MLCRTPQNENFRAGFSNQFFTAITAIKITVKKKLQFLFLFCTNCNRRQSKKVVIKVIFKRVDFDIAKLYYITVNNRVNFFAIDLDEISVVAIADTSLIFDLVDTINPYNIIEINSIVEDTVHCIDKKTILNESGLDKKVKNIPGILSSNWLILPRFAKYMIELFDIFQM